MVFQKKTVTYTLAVGAQLQISSKSLKASPGAPKFRKHRAYGYDETMTILAVAYWSAPFTSAMNGRPSVALL
jgi:hypothetical protein